MGCVNLIVMDIFNSAWSVFENIIIWTMPIPVVWKLKVPRDRKGQSPYLPQYQHIYSHLRSGPLHPNRRLLHRSHRLLCPDQCARALDPIHGHLLELPASSPPLHDPIMRRPRHLLPSSYLPPTAQTYSRADLPPPVAHGRSRP